MKLVPITIKKVVITPEPGWTGYIEGYIDGRKRVLNIINVAPVETISNTTLMAQLSTDFRTIGFQAFGKTASRSSMSRRQDIRVNNFQLHLSPIDSPLTATDQISGQLIYWV